MDTTIEALERRVADLERRLDALAPEPPRFGGPDPEVLALVRAGNKLEAIKRYRELTGVGLAEARDAVERL